MNLISEMKHELILMLLKYYAALILWAYCMKINYLQKSCLVRRIKWFAEKVKMLISDI